VDRPLIILHLEDDPRDAFLVGETLRQSGLDPEVRLVHTRADYTAALERGDVDLILSDYSLPQFDGLSALQIARRIVPDTPFILVSGTLGEDAAVESLRSGATDYLLKTRLHRLGPAVLRAVDEHEGRRGRRVVERALERERKFLRALLESLETGVIACDQHGTLTLFNRATRELYGMPADAVAFGPWSARCRLLDADGETPLAPDAFPLARAFRGEPLRPDELTIERPDGAARAVLASGESIVDDAGTRLGAVVTLQDITERRLLESQLRQAQRMEAMGRLAAGVAHDFNNLLTVINGFCHLARSRQAEADPVRADLDEIAKAGERASQLTRQLLAFSRQQVLEPRVLDLNAVAGDLERMLRPLIGADIELMFSPSDALEKVHADAGQMEQVLMNLLVNARDAMEQGGVITVETANIDVDGSGHNRQVAGTSIEPVRGPLARTPEVPAGRYVTLTVTDTGCGMDEETQAHIFEPFFTTKEVGRGTGLGLSTVHGIITQSGGHVAVHSEPGLGARFRIYLPRAANVSVASEPAPTASPLARGTETILVVDDDRVVLRLVSEVLTRQGYTVLRAASGQEALILLGDVEQRIDAMVIDVVMPGLSGREVAQRLGGARAELPILFMSGYGPDGPGSQGALEPEIDFLPKPFLPDALIARVREVLDQRMAA
jgi:signal transduction histidine kinase